MSRRERLTIRKARLTDVPAIQKIINHYADEGKMLPRSANYICERIRDYQLLVIGRRVVAVCGLHLSWGKLAEIVSLAVRKGLAGRGYGRMLVRSCLREARQLGVEEVFALTKVPDFFLRQGFVFKRREELPRKIWTDCVNCAKFPDCDEQAVVLDMKRRSTSRS